MADTPERARARGLLHRLFPESTSIRQTESAIAKREKALEDADKETADSKSGVDAGEMEPKWDDRFKKG